MNAEEQIKLDICEVGKRIYERGFVASNDGNISVRMGENEVWTTPTGVSKGFMTPEMLVKVDLDGNVLEGSRKVTTELPMHLRVYKERPDVKAVVHAHPPYATTYAVCGKPLDKYISTETIVSFGHVPIAPFAMPSTQEVPDSIAELIQQCDALLLENHGALTCGHDLYNAYNKMESVEFFAQLCFNSTLLGGGKELSEENLERLVELRKKYNIPGKHPGIRLKRKK